MTQENIIKKRPFSFWDYENSEGQSIKTPTFIKAGIKINVYQLIQANREDTEIIPTLEKYGSIQRMQTNKIQLYEDVTKMGDLRNALEQIKKGKEIWQSLDTETKNIFSNNVEKFINEAPEYYRKEQEKIKLEIEKNKPQKEEIKEEIK